MTSFAIITGATGGMGRAVAKRLAHAYDLILTDIDLSTLDQFASELPGAAKTIAGDIADPKTSAALADVVGQTPLGPIVHTAGLSPTMAEARRILDVNLAGTARLAAATLPHCRHGTVFVVIASQAGHSASFDKLTPLLDDPLGKGVIEQLSEGVGAPAAYAISKRGVMRFTQREAKLWGERGGRIVSISPGLINTPMGRAELESSPVLQQITDAQPVPRMGKAEEIADAVEFLISDKAMFITGADLLVDGGSLAVQRTRPEIAKLLGG